MCRVDGCGLECAPCVGVSVCPCGRAGVVVSQGEPLQADFAAWFNTSEWNIAYQSQASAEAALFYEFHNNATNVSVIAMRGLRVRRAWRFGLLLLPWLVRCRVWDVSRNPSSSRVKSRCGPRRSCWTSPSVCFLALHTSPTRYGWHSWGAWWACVQVGVKTRLHRCCVWLPGGVVAVEEHGMAGQQQ